MAKKPTLNDAEEKRTYKDALVYHEYSTLEKNHRLPGKIEIIPSKKCLTQRELSLAYTPGVAAPSIEIAKDAKKISSYTGRSNLVAVVTNGTAVLGLGNIGPLAAKPVMEGKAVLFKKFANINVFDIELKAPTPEEVIKACQMIEPTVGGINLEDIKAPDCFTIEETLQKTLSIPIFHDDQHGTAIIVAAALMNALKLVKKNAKDVKIVFSGAGAAAIACAKHLLHFGMQRNNVFLCDTQGVVHSERRDLDPYKLEWAQKTKLRTLPQVLKGADVFIGVSVGGIVTKAMVRTMAKRPIIFALANPNPEIRYHEARKARPDAIVATGRSDFPNQVNNVLGFPSIFRGALDVEARAINEEMKIAASKALATLAQQDIPDSVLKIYGNKNFTFGPEYIIPKPFDPRVLLWVAPAVAEAAIKSRVARKKINLKEYREQLESRLDPSRQIMALAIQKARQKLSRIVFPEGHFPKILKAAHILQEEKIAEPILIGNPRDIKGALQSLNLKLNPLIIHDPRTDPNSKRFAAELHKLRQRKGLSFHEAERFIERKTYFGLMMLKLGMVDALVSGFSKSYPETIRPALQIIRMNSKYKYAAGLFIMLLQDRVLFFADTTVTIDPTAEQLAEITLQTAERVEFFHIKPKIALISFSNFGSSPHPINQKINGALQIIRHKRPDLMVDGEMQADTAVSMERLAEYSFSQLKEPANVLIFPSLASGNIAYKLLQRLGNADVIGPILMGPRKPVHVLQQGCSVEEIVRITTIAAAEANSL